jgi:hypothetical protein
MGETLNAYNILVRKPLGKRAVGKLRRILEDNINTNLRQIGFEDRNSMELAQDRVQ